MTESKSDNIIYDILKKYPEKEWLPRIHDALPTVDDGYIMSVIEIAFGGDEMQIDENGIEQSAYPPLS